MIPGSDEANLSETVIHYRLLNEAVKNISSFLASKYVITVKSAKMSHSV